jgi:hypothetical protein
MKIDYKKRSEELEKIILDIYWMARRYAHGRQTYAVSQYNEAINKAIELGVDIKPDPIDNLIEAKDRMFDKKWFESQTIENTK